MVRYWLDVPGQEKRIRPSAPIGPCVGPNRLTESEAQRRGSEIIRALGIDTEEYFHQVTSPMQTFAQKAEWMQANDPAFLEGSPGWIDTMESALNRHILPFLGSLPLAAVTEQKVQELVTRLKTTTLERRAKDGHLIRSYRLSRKTIREIIAVVKKVVGRKVWINWEIRLGKAEKPKQRTFTEQQMRDIVNEARPGMWKLFYTVLASTGIRVGECCGLMVEDIDFDQRVIRVRRTFCERTGKMRPPKTDAGNRDVDIDEHLARELRQYLAGRTSGLLFSSRSGTPLRPGNVLKRNLHPILKKLGIPLGGKLSHAFRHGRVTVLRKHKVPEDLVRHWVGHTTLEMTDRYSHVGDDIEYRQQHVVGFREQ